MDISPANLADLLRRRGVIGSNESASVTILGGGISNHVLKVVTPSRSLVIKQALPQLRVAEEWCAAPDRALREASALRLLADVIPGAVPAVVAEDADNYWFAIECAPDGTLNWKDELFAGRVDESVARHVGELLARIQGIREVPVEFRRYDTFESLRIDPYFRFMQRTHPDLRPVVEGEIELLLGNPQCLVHGDFSPKNMLLLPSDGIWLLDAEVAHWGDPVFDPAFCLNHLLLKSFVRSPREPYFAAARAFTAGYSRFSSLDTRHFFRVLGMLMLARVDGKSKVEYITDDATRDRVRAAARQIITEEHHDLEEVLALIANH